MTSLVDFNYFKSVHFYYSKFKKIFFIFLLTGISSLASGKSAADSLKRLPQTNLPDSLMIANCNNTAMKLKYSNPDSAAFYFKRGLSLLKSTHQKGNGCGIYNNWASAEAEWGNYNLALSLSDSAVKYYAIENPNDISNPMLVRANIYLATSNYELATEEYLKILKIQEKEKLGPLICMIYSNLILVLNNSKKHEIALEYCKKEYDVAIKINEETEIGWACSNFFETLKALDRLPEAKIYADRLYQISKKLNDVDLMAVASTDMGDLKSFDKKYEQAIVFYKDAAELNKKVDDNISLCNSLNNIAQNYQYLKKPDDASDYLNQSLVLGLKMKAREQQKDTYGLLATNAEMKNDFKNAYRYSLLNQKLADSLLNEKSQQNIIDMQAKYKSDEKQKEIEIQSLKLNEQEATISHERLIQNFGIIFSVFVLVISILFIGRYRQVQKQKQMSIREKISRELHDHIGSSLGSIANFSELAKNKSENFSGINQGELLDKIEITSRETIANMSDIVWAINPKNDTMEKMVERMENFALDLLSPKNIAFEFDIEKNIVSQKLDLDKRKTIFPVFKEAIYNAMKYSACKKIQVRIYKEEDRINLEVKDDGNGFELTGVKSRNGNGIQNMKIRAQEINGVLEIKSIINKGTSIKLSFSS